MGLIDSVRRAEMEHTPMTPFDLLTCSESTRMLKLILPFTPPSSQRSLALLIKVTELQQTVKYFKGFSADAAACSMGNEKQSMMEIFNSIKDYLPKAQQESFDSIAQIMQMMELFSQMNEEGNFSQGFPSGFAEGFPEGFADMFSGGFPGHNSEGGENNGSMDESSEFSEDGSSQTETDSNGCQSDQGEKAE